MIDLEQVPKLDLILSGSVAVNLKGARVGKGGGFSDLEYALLAEARQGLGQDGDRDHRPPDPDPARGPVRRPTHDIPVDLIVTPRAAIEVERAATRPRGHALGPPPAAADPRDPGAGAHGLRLRRAATLATGSRASLDSLSTTTTTPHETSPRTPQLRRCADDYGPHGRSEWLDIDWRAAPALARPSHGARVNYVEMGEGPPLVFVHGLSGCWQNWLENIPHFARATA